MSEIVAEAKAPQPPKARNFVAKNATRSGAGAHKDKKKAAKQGDVKHKKPFTEAEDKVCPQCGMKDCTCAPGKCNCKPKPGYPKKEGVAEAATAGATSSGNVTVGAVYPNKKGKSLKNKDGTVKNAQDMKGNLLTGGSIAKR